jgi:hypothetical protein
LKETTMPYSLNTSIYYTQLVATAYQVDSGDAPIFTPPVGVVFESIQALYANDLATDISFATDYVPFGFVARVGTTLVVALRGTDHIWEWVDDVEFLSIPCPIAGATGSTEDGFTGVYMSLRTDHDDNAPTVAEYVRSQLRLGDSVVVTGHSLGAALATLCAYDLTLNVLPAPPIVYTYACPNVGNNAFATDYNAKVPDTYRVINPFDVVPHVPLRLPLGMGYQQVGQTFAYNPAGALKIDIGCMHILPSYQHLLGVAAGVAAQFPVTAPCMP